MKIGDLKFDIADIGDFDYLIMSFQISFSDLSFKYLSHRDAIPSPAKDPSILKVSIQNDEIIKIKLKDQIIGGYKFKDRTESSCRLHFIWIDTKMQGNGIGKLTWAHIEQSNPDIKHWNLYTPEFLLSNHKFYERLGFKFMKTIESYVKLRFYVKDINI